MQDLLDYSEHCMGAPFLRILFCGCVVRAEWRLGRLTDDEDAIVAEAVGRHLEVEGRGALADAARGVVVGAVARAVVAAVVAGVGDGHAAQVSANAEHDEPVGPNRAVLVLLGVAQRRHVDALLARDLVGRAVADEQGLASPLERGVLTFRNITEIDFNLGKGQHIGGRAHRLHKLRHNSLGGVYTSETASGHDEVRRNLPRVIMAGATLCDVQASRCAVVIETGDAQVRVREADLLAGGEGAGHGHDSAMVGQSLAKGPSSEGRRFGRHIFGAQFEDPLGHGPGLRGDRGVEAG